MHFNKSLRVLLILFIISIKCEAQTKWVIENYNYLGQPGTSTVVPMIHFETPKNWYAELRYNYEDNQTISFFGGKTFKGTRNLEYSLTPLVGFSAGNFTGISFGTNAEMGWRKIYLSSQTQYSFGSKKSITDFFFSWSEIGYNISPVFFAGLAMQYTRQIDNNSFEPGFVAGWEVKNFTFPVYVFSPYRKERYFVVGINYEYNLKKKYR